jgi:hypothetical protein
MNRKYRMKAEIVKGASCWRMFLSLNILIIPVKGVFP